MFQNVLTGELVAFPKLPTWI